MASAELFARLGLFVRPDFFTPAEAAWLRQEAARAPADLATVRDRGQEYAVDEQTRRTTVARVEPRAQALVLERLEALRPALLAHFGVTAAGWRRPQFLVYRVGDFFRAHEDGARDPGAPSVSRDRRVSVVVFLNDEAPEPSPGTYGGGALTFFGLLADPRLKARGLALTGQAGLLVAFRPDVLHEVTEVTHGERYTIVTWLAD